MGRRSSGARAALAAALAAAVGMAFAGCGATRESTPGTSTPRPSPTGALAATSPSPAVNPSPTESGLIDRSWAWLRIAWSPDSRLLGAVASEQTMGDARIRIFDRSGRVLATLPGTDFTWVDDTQVISLDGSSESLDGPVTLRAVAGAGSVELLARGRRVLGNSRGAVAIALATLEDEPPFFRIWRDGTLSRSRAGIPVLWSDDGTRLVVYHPASSPIGSAPSAMETPDIVLAAGGPIPSWIEVLALPDFRPTAGFPDDPIDGRLRPILDATGDRLAAVDLEARPIVFDLRDGSILRLATEADLLDWLPDGRLAIECFDPDLIVQLWDVALPAAGPALTEGTIVESVHDQIHAPPDGTDEYVPLLDPGARSPDRTLRAFSRERGLYLVAEP